MARRNGLGSRVTDMKQTAPRLESRGALSRLAASKLKNWRLRATFRLGNPSVFDRLCQIGG